VGPCSGAVRPRMLCTRFIGGHSTRALLPRVRRARPPLVVLRCALIRPRTQNVTAETADHEDHTFSGIMFDIKTNKLPLEYIEVGSVWVRGDLGGSGSALRPEEHACAHGAGAWANAEQKWPCRAEICLFSGVASSYPRNSRSLQGPSPSGAQRKPTMESRRRRRCARRPGAPAGLM